jgi:hypothetical protein
MSHTIAQHVAVLVAGMLIPAVYGLDTAGVGMAVHRQGRVNQDAQLSVDFLKRVEAYIDLHKKVESTLPERPKKPTPDQINTHERALARIIAQTRPRAQQGDLFTRDTRAYFRRQITRAFAAPDAAGIRDSIMDENPGPIQLRINGRYPDTVPLATMPPQVLAALPKLPEELEYRFIGNRLILLDVHAQMVVDYIEDALPK